VHVVHLAHNPADPPRVHQRRSPEHHLLVVRYVIGHRRVKVARAATAKAHALIQLLSLLGQGSFAIS
jgi:hypothetical protein